MNLTTCERPHGQADRIRRRWRYQRRYSRAIVARQAQDGEALYCKSNKTLYLPRREWVVMP